MTSELEADSVYSWDKQPRESARAYEAARLYFEMRADRSHAAVAQKLRKNKSLIERWSSKWRWIDRALAFDAHLSAQERNACETAARKDAEKWQRRQEEERERKFDRGLRIGTKVDRMLQFPLATTTRSDGETKVHPARWSLRDIALLAATSSKLIGQAIRNEGAAITSAESALCDETWVIEDYGSPAEPAGGSLP